MTFAKGKTAHVYIRVTDMKDNTIKLSDLKYIDDYVYEHIKNYTINASDLYLTIAGTIGSVGIVPNEVDGMNLTENAAKLTQIGCKKSIYSMLFFQQLHRNILFFVFIKLHNLSCQLKLPVRLR